MRDLFVSERRYIENVIRAWQIPAVDLRRPVVVEFYAAPDTLAPTRFNNDFMLQLVTDEERRRVNSKSYCAPILINTLGVDVFVSLDTKTGQLYRTELLGGEAFSMKYFKEHIKKIEDCLAHLDHPVNLYKAAYCRIFVIGNDICFLAFPNETVPVARGQSRMLIADAESEIACSLDGDEIVYVDGWIRTAVTITERKLEAIPVRSKRSAAR